MKTVAIVGVGLIGGSFGLALRKSGFTGELLGVSSPLAIQAGLKRGAISREASLEEALKVADLIYLAQPVDRILQTLEAIGGLSVSGTQRSGGLITDAGSTKAAIVQRASECLHGAVFLGGHPLAGKEQRGVEAADADLFRGRPYVLTPTSGPLARARGSEAFKHWLAHIGAHLIEMSPAEHDATVAFTSHLPQLLSTALAGTLARQNNPYIREVFGSGLLDMTRLALSDPDLWASILATNKTDVVIAVNELLAALRQLRDSIESEDSARFFECAAEFSSTIRKIHHET